MKKSNLLTKNCIQKEYLNNKSIKKLSIDFEKIIRVLNKEIDETEKTLNILSSKFKLNFKIKDLQKFKKFKTIALIGMGGSILGAEAINNFLTKDIKKKVYFFNNIDSKKITVFKKKENLNKVLFLVISKSGNTIETISNFLSLNILKKNSKNIIIISEKKNNLLFSLSKKFNLFFIEHKNYIGGRFSVLSEVGIIPAYLMGLNIFQFRSSVQKFLKGKKKLFLKESSVILSSLLNDGKIKNIVFLNYSPEIEKFLFWCQQLIAESLGKKNSGFLPMISTVPKDHHSLLQLYLDGPKDKIFHIFSSKEKLKVKINVKNFENKINFLQKKTLSSVKNAQRKALIKTLKKNKIPFREFRVNKINENVLGQLFSYFILETVIIGRLVKVDPFNQPAVEEVKVLTKKILSQKHQK